MSTGFSGLAALKKNINAALFETMQPASFEKSRLGRVVEKIENDGSVSLKHLGYAPRIQEMKGTIRPQGVISLDGPTIINLDWEVSMDVHRRDLTRDSVLGMYRSRIKDMAQEIIDHPYERAIQFLLEGDGSTYGLCYDGQYFYDSDHVDKGAKYTTNQDNDLTTSIVLKTAPTLAEITARFRAARLAGANYVDDQGRLFSRGGSHRKGLVVLCPMSYEGVFEEMLESKTLPGPSGGVITNTMAKAAELWSEPLYTDTDSWQLLKLDRPTKPLILQYEKMDGQEWIVENTEPGSDQWVKSNIVTFTVKGTYNLGYGQWRYATRDVLTTT